MKKNFSSNDFKQLNASFHSTSASLFDLRNRQKEFYEKSIVDLASALVDKEVMNLLANIPIEDINKNKLGIKTKNLRARGIRTIADAYHRNLSSYTSNAKEVKEIINQTIKEVRQSVKLQISIDNRTKESTSLVNYLVKYRDLLSYIDKIDEYEDLYIRELDSLSKSISKGSSSFKWLFTNKKNKELINEQYARFEPLFQEFVKEATTNVLKPFAATSKIQYIKSWEIFEKESASLLSILDTLRPDVIQDENNYGLSDELATSISEEVIHSEGLTCTLRRYQEWGVKYILHQKKVLLGDEMGLGKTIQAIAAMTSLYNTGHSHFVVVCPLSVLTNWEREIYRFSMLQVFKIHGNKKEEELASWIKEGGVALTTYETTGIFNFNKGFKYDFLIVDEAHYVKNKEAIRSQNVSKIAKFTDRILYMTGTALENNLDEMVKLINDLNPALAKQISSMLVLSNSQVFKEKIAPVYYRRRREDVLTELPEKEEIEQWCTLLPQEEKIYEKSILEHNFMGARQLSWNIKDLSLSSKAIRLKEIVEMAKEENRKVLIFSFFLDTLFKIKEELKDIAIGPIYGAVPPEQRQQMIDDFDKAENGSVLISQILSGGTGLNIQSASVVIICEPQFKPSIENQAISRAYRMGQVRNVLVYRLLAENTIDERILNILKEKQKLFDDYADESKSWEESVELDKETFSSIVEEEITRINNKNENAI